MKRVAILGLAVCAAAACDSFGSSDDATSVVDAGAHDADTSKSDGGVSDAGAEDGGEDPNVVLHDTFESLSVDQPCGPGWNAGGGTARVKADATGHFCQWCPPPLAFSTITRSVVAKSTGSYQATVAMRGAPPSDGGGCRIALKNYDSDASQDGTLAGPAFCAQDTQFHEVDQAGQVDVGVRVEIEISNDNTNCIDIDNVIIRFTPGD